VRTIQTPCQKKKAGKKKQAPSITRLLCAALDIVSGAVLFSFPGLFILA
jgi:hypothetical protein